MDYVIGLSVETSVALNKTFLLVEKVRACDQRDLFTLCGDHVMQLIKSAKIRIFQVFYRHYKANFMLCAQPTGSGIQVAQRNHNLWSTEGQTKWTLSTGHYLVNAIQWSVSSSATKPQFFTLGHIKKVTHQLGFIKRTKVSN